MRTITTIIGDRESHFRISSQAGNDPLKCAAASSGSLPSRSSPISIIADRESVSKEAKSEVYFLFSRRERRETPSLSSSSSSRGRRKSARTASRCASGNSLYPVRKLDVSRRRGVIGSSRGSSKLRNAIMSRHFCHRRQSIIE